MSKAALAALALASLVHAEAARSVRVVVERSRAGEWAAVDPRTVFNAGDTVRFHVEATFPGFLYVLNLTSRGEYLWLFPTSQTGMDNAIEAGREYAIPATEGAFTIPPSPGFDTIYWIVSPAKLPEAPSLAEAPRAKGAPSPLRPRCQSGPLRARGLCLDDAAGARPLQKPADLPPVLGSHPAPPPLKVERSDTSNQISGGAEGPFIYEFRLAHR